jgi:hypothetical protein
MGGPPVARVHSAMGRSSGRRRDGVELLIRFSAATPGAGMGSAEPRPGYPRLAVDCIAGGRSAARVPRWRSPEEPLRAADPAR